MNAVEPFAGAGGIKDKCLGGVFFIRNEHGRVVADRDANQQQSCN
jgi:hypothetical protein